jgi:hydrogenase maturation factor
MSGFRFGALETIVRIENIFSILVATFSTLYWNYGSAANFSVSLTRLDAVYFAIGTLTTAGTGTIAAISQTARGIQTVQMILDLVLVVFAVTLVLGLSRLALRRLRLHHVKQISQRRMALRAA